MASPTSSHFSSRILVLILSEFVVIHRMGDNSEMNHRGHQSSSEDTRSRNKRSEVLWKYQALDGAFRRQAMEALGSQPQTASRTELWNRKDLTCRILLVRYISYSSVAAYVVLT